MEFRGDDVLVVTNLSKRFGNFQAVRGVSFKVKKNSIFGLLGSNGAGKSTVMHMLTGLLSPTYGSIEILGKTVKNRYPKELKYKVAIVPQKISLYEDLTIFDNLYFFGRAYGLKGKEVKRRINYLESVLSLGELNRRVKNLSGGYQRRVSLACALIGDPEILILDEALVGIDLETRKIIVDFLAELKKYKTIIITTHSMNEAQSLCDYVIFIHKGKKIEEGYTKEILTEYHKNHGSKVIITFENEDIAKEVYIKLSERFKHLTLKTNAIVLESRSSKYDVSNIIQFIEEIGHYKSSIEEIDVDKPGLGEVMLDLIKRGSD